MQAFPGLREGVVLSAGQWLASALVEAVQSAPASRATAAAVVSMVCTGLLPAV